jgi:hypothetical protein
MRNFLYNKSDILIAVIIIAVAAVIIWTRVDAIMGSGDEDKETPTVTSDAPVAPDVAPTDGAVTEETPVDGEQASEGEQPSDDGSGEDEPVDEEPVEFTVEVGSSASVVAGDLEAEGLVETADAFLKELKKQKAETKLKAGTFKIKPGTKVSTIVKKLTN